MANLTTLVSFDGDDGDAPVSTLVLDADGTLVGATQAGGRFGDGTVFEIAPTACGTADVPTTVLNLNHATIGSVPYSLTLNPATGDLFVETFAGGLGGLGTVLQIAKTADGYAGTPTILLSNSLANYAIFATGPFVIDAQGDLYGDASNGTFLGGVLEISNISAGYQHPASTVVNFGNEGAVFGTSSLVEDAAGNLFGAGSLFGAISAPPGLIYEVAKTESGYSSAPLVIAPIEGTVVGPLTMDARGDLFGVATPAGRGGSSFVFVDAKTVSGYEPQVVVLAKFDAADGASVEGGVIFDPKGDLFGVTELGGAHGDGSVYEIVHSDAGYDSTPVTVFSFDGTDGSQPTGALTPDAEGDLFGTTSGGGADHAGTVFEITDPGFATCFCPGTRILTDGGEVAVEALAIGDQVVTLDGVAPVRWVGQRHYDGRFVAGNHLVLPVCFNAGSLAEGVPGRDLFVSPGHGMWVDGQLVPAWRLVNGVSVVQAASVERVSYYHVELDRHAVMLAEGASVESFLDDGGRGHFQNAAEFQALYPEAALMTPLQARLEDGFALQVIQARIAALAGVAAPVGPAGALHGFVDVAGPGVVSGWAQDGDSAEEPVALEVLVAGDPVVCVLANGYRADLRRAGLGSGCHAFAAVLPEGLCGAVTVRRVGDGAVLAHAVPERLAA